MATVTEVICDRCGKPLKYIGWTANLRNVFKRGKTVKITKFYNGNSDGYSYSESQYELCADCTKELKVFLDGKNEDGTVNISNVGVFDNRH